MRMQLLMSVTCVLGAVACGGSATDQQAVNDPSNVQATTTTGAAVNAPIVTAGSDVNESGAAVHSDPPAMNGGVQSNVGAHTNFSGSTPAPVNAGSAGAQLGATPMVPASSAPTTDNTVASTSNGHPALTPMNQGNSKSETEITASIRRQVMADKSLSFTAKNVKIITVGTKVTLRGAVKSDAEKSSIDSAARNSAGVTAVDDQIEIKP